MGAQVQWSKISKSYVFQWSRDHWKTEKNGSHGKTEHPWKTEQTLASQIPNEFSIPAPTIEIVVSPRRRKL